MIRSEGRLQATQFTFTHNSAFCVVLYNARLCICQGGQYQQKRRRLLILKVLSSLEPARQANHPRQEHLFRLLCLAHRHLYHLDRQEQQATPRTRLNFFHRIGIRAAILYYQKRQPNFDAWQNSVVFQYLRQIFLTKSVQALCYCCSSQTSLRERLILVFIIAPTVTLLNNEAD